MVTLLKATKNIISGRSPGTEAPNAPDGRIDRIDQAKVLWYQWTNELSTDAGQIFGFESPVAFSSPASELAKTRSYDISNHIESFAYTKGMGAAAGTFQIVLQDSFDWSRYMKPGQWICVFLAGDGSLPLPAEKPAKGSSFVGPSVLGTALGLVSTPELPLPPGPDSEQVKAIASKNRCIGIIQRVGIRSQTSIDGSVTLTYTITGKDFGTIYEETELWFNANNADAQSFDKIINSISQQFARNITELLKQYHNIFLNPADMLSKQQVAAFSFFPKQWVVPDRLVKDLGLGFREGTGYFGDLENLTEFNATVFENPLAEPLAGLQGRCWDRLKSLSQSEYHELFTELSDEGHPRIIFRPIPWAADKSRYPVTGKLIMSYSDLANPGPVAPPLALGSVAANFSSFKALESAVEAAKSLTGALAGRTQHSIPLTAAEVESFDIGPDFHSRTNFFFVDAMTAAKDQNNAWALMAKSPIPVFPFRDENDIQRHGFKPMFVNVHSFLVSNSQLFGNSAHKDFMLELNAILQDYHSNAEDFYSGSFMLAAGKNTVKLGKVLLTDNTFKAINEMVFYIEGYTDNFVVNTDGTCSWTQTVSVTRGVEKTDLAGIGTKQRQPTKSSTFHAFGGSSGDLSTLDKVKNIIKNPKDIF